MNTTTTKPNQSMPDLILMLAGTLEAGMQIMAANNKSISELPITGSTLSLPDSVVTDTENLLYLQQNNIVIGTAG